VLAHEGSVRRHGQGAVPAEHPPRGLRLAGGVEELAVLDHLRPDATVDAPAEVLDELAVYELTDRRSHLVGMDGRREAQGRGAQKLQFQVVVPRRSGGEPPAAIEAVHQDGVAPPRLEYRLHARPVLCAGERLRADGLDLVDIEQRPGATGHGDQVLCADPARQPVAGEGSNRDHG